MGSVKEAGLCLELCVLHKARVCVPGTVLGNLRETAGVQWAAYEKWS